MSCAVTELIRKVGNRWSLSLLHVLAAGPLRFQALHEALPGISTRTLTDRLRELEGLGVLRREVFAEAPPRVEYALSPSGQHLESVLGGLANVAPLIPSSRSGARNLPAKGLVGCPTCEGQPNREIRPVKVTRKRAGSKARRIPPPPPPPGAAPVAEERFYYPPPSLNDVTLL